jgi:hypothetical protein
MHGLMCFVTYYIYHHRLLRLLYHFGPDILIAWSFQTQLLSSDCYFRVPHLVTDLPSVHFCQKSDSRHQNLSLEKQLHPNF